MKNKLSNRTNNELSERRNEPSVSCLPISSSWITENSALKSNFITKFNKGLQPLVHNKEVFMRLKYVLFIVLFLTILTFAQVPQSIVYRGNLISIYRKLCIFNNQITFSISDTNRSAISAGSPSQITPPLRFSGVNIFRT